MLAHLDQALRTQPQQLRGWVHISIAGHTDFQILREGGEHCCVPCISEILQYIYILDTRARFART